MEMYDFLSRNTVSGRKYALKFFLAALPVIILALAGPLVLIAADKNIRAITITGIILSVLACLSVAFTLYAFKKLVAPVRMANDALNSYLSGGRIPELPTTHQDEIGMLMSNIQATFTQLNNLIVEKSDMIDLLSHDLRSPVGRILSLSNLIKEDEAEREIYADYIINECRSLLNMLENILLTLKEDSQEFKLERVNLYTLVCETAAFFDFVVTEKNMAINIDISDNLYIFAQRQLFTQAVRNLLGNAIKFSPDGKAIDISARQEDDRILITIKDEGLGFNPLDIQKIFNRFTTAGKKGMRGETSTGLGLYLSKKIIEKHGGKLLAESEGENRGASFTIVLFTLITKKPQDKNGRRPAVKKVMAVHSR